jgi:hypothetical protein
MLAEAMVRLSRGRPTRRYNANPHALEAFRHYLALATRSSNLDRMHRAALPALQEHYQKQPALPEVFSSLLSSDDPGDLMAYLGGLEDTGYSGGTGINTAVGRFIRSLHHMHTMIHGDQSEAVHSGFHPNNGGYADPDIRQMIQQGMVEGVPSLSNTGFADGPPIAGLLGRMLNSHTMRSHPKRVILGNLRDQLTTTGNPMDTIPAHDILRDTLSNSTTTVPGNDQALDEMGRLMRVATTGLLTRGRERLGGGNNAR